MLTEVEELINQIGTEEERHANNLLPELKLYYEEGDRYPMLRHPLVYEVPFYSAKIANQIYENKLHAVREARKKGDWFLYLTLHERPYRMIELSNLWFEGEINREQLRELLRFVWVDAEFPSQFEGLSRDLFEKAGFVTDNEDQLTLPPGEYVIYRGCQENELMGLSWTRSIDKAVWFAKRFRENGKVYRATINAENVLGVFNGRGEQEYVVCPESLRDIQVYLEHDDLDDDDR